MKRRVRKTRGEKADDDNGSVVMMTTIILKNDESDRSRLVIPANILHEFVLHCMN